MRTAFVCLLATVLIGACAPTNPYRQAGDPPGLQKQCDAVGALAAVVMAARQTGRSREDVIQSLTKKGSRKGAEPIRTVVDVAYKAHLEPTAARKRAVVQSFASYAIKVCYRAYRKTRLESDQSGAAPAEQAPAQRGRVRSKPRKK